MNKIAKTALAASLAIAGIFGVSGVAQAADALDIGSPYLTHGELGYSHVRGGDWVITSIAKGDSFASYNAPTAVSSLLVEGKTIERLRLTFTPDAGFSAADLQAEFASEVADGSLTVGSTWFNGFRVGSAQVLNGKIVVHVFRIVNG